MAQLEICVEDLTSLAAARDGGADRVELCAALALGGVSPARPLVVAAVAEGLPVHVLVRLASGGFVVDPAMAGQMTAEIAALRLIGASGVVVGALDRAGELDMPSLRRWRDAAGPIEVTLHRAIDLARDPVAAVEQAAAIGIDRVLTSGGAASAVAGLPTIARMAAAARGRIAVMAGAGVTPADAATILDTGVDALHASAAASYAWDDPRIAGFGFGGPMRRVTEVGTVRALRTAIDEHRRAAPAQAPAAGMAA